MRSLDYPLTKSAALACSIIPSMLAQMRRKPPKACHGLSFGRAFALLGLEVPCRFAGVDARMSPLAAKREG